MSTKWYTRPIVCVSNVERSLAFYTDKLGFAEAWRHAEDGKTLVAQVGRSGCELILSSQWPDKNGSGLIFISLHPDLLAAVRAEFERVRDPEAMKGVDKQDKIDHQQESPPRHSADKTP